MLAEHHKKKSVNALVEWVLAEMLALMDEEKARCQ